MRRRGLRRKKWNITKLDDPSIAKDFQLELQNRFQLLEDEVDTNDTIADSLLEQSTTIITKAADEVLGIHRPKKKPWISDATLALTDERRKARKKAIQDPSCRHEYNHLTRSTYFKGLKADKEKWFNGKCQIRETKVDEHVFNTIKTITKGINRSPTSSSIRSSSGELLSNPDEVKPRWFEYGKALCNHQPTIDSSCLNAPTFGPNHCSEPAILRSEIVAAVKKLKAGKAR